MPEREDFLGLGTELANLIESLPPEEKDRFYHGLAALVHDLRQAIGIIYTADSLLLRGTDLSPEDTELMQAIERASKRAVTILSDFSKPFDT
jgi:signal transduction histidine kinase